MAGFFQDFLQGATDGFVDSTTIRDYKHASKTFVTDAYGYAPKFKWLFHCYFDINRAFLGPQYTFPEDSNHGLLVKSVQLPKFNGNVQELNQYNRKRYIHNKISYDPITISFHDDNNNIIKNMWVNYYNYYFLDGSNKVGISPGNGGIAVGNQTNIYNNSLQGQDNWGYNGSTSYGLTTDLGIAKAPFFNNIKIFGFNQHNFVCYELINPIIDNFSHDQYDYSQTNATMEHQMTVKYETVKYYDGAMNGEQPWEVAQGFGIGDHYDRQRSYLSRPGSTRKVLGPGGLVDAGIGFVDDLTSGDPNRLLRGLQTGLTAARTFKNPQSIVKTFQAEIVDNIKLEIARTPLAFPTSSKNPSNTSNPTTPEPVNTNSNTPTP